MISRKLRWRGFTFVKFNQKNLLKLEKFAELIKNQQKLGFSRTHVCVVAGVAIVASQIPGVARSLPLSRDRIVRRRRFGQQQLPRPGIELGFPEHEAAALPTTPHIHVYNWARANDL